MLIFFYKYIKLIRY